MINSIWIKSNVAWWISDSITNTIAFKYNKIWPNPKLWMRFCAYRDPVEHKHLCYSFTVTFEHSKLYGSVSVTIARSNEINICSIWEASALCQVRSFRALQIVRDDSSSCPGRGMFNGIGLRLRSRRFTSSCDTLPFAKEWILNMLKGTYLKFSVENLFFRDFIW